jgi:hypothetical protein
LGQTTNIWDPVSSRRGFGFSLGCGLGYTYIWG